MSRETLICDTSFIGHLRQRDKRPERYGHWDDRIMARVRTATLAISIVTIAEIRAGFAKARWGSRRIAREELRLGKFPSVLIDDPHLDEWARLWMAARTSGVALSDNDLWIAAAAAVQGQTLVTCDRDHLRIAPELGGEVLYLRPPV